MIGGSGRSKPGSPNSMPVRFYPKSRSRSSIAACYAAMNSRCRPARLGTEEGMTNTLLTLHDPAAARRYYAEGLWRDETLYGLLATHAAERPDDFALRDGSRRLTWGALLRC